jgi:hypothetical protein
MKGKDEDFWVGDLLTLVPQSLRATVTSGRKQSSDSSDLASPSPLGHAPLGSRMLTIASVTEHDGSSMFSGSSGLLLGLFATSRQMYTAR